jgi:hypothetical protein
MTLLHDLLTSLLTRLARIETDAMTITEATSSLLGHVSTLVTEVRALLLTAQPDPAVQAAVERLNAAEPELQLLAQEVHDAANPPLP